MHVPVSAVGIAMPRRLNFAWNQITSGRISRSAQCIFYLKYQMALNWIILCFTPSKGLNRKCFLRLFSLITVQKWKYRLILPFERWFFVGMENSLKFMKSSISPNTAEFKCFNSFFPSRWSHQEKVINLTWC